MASFHLFYDWIPFIEHISSEGYLPDQQSQIQSQLFEKCVSFTKHQ